MSEAKAARPGWASFALALAMGAVLAFAVFMGVRLGDCIEPIGSAAMRDCVASRQREFWLFPALLLAIFALAFWQQSRGSRWGQALALAGAMIAAVAMISIEWLIGLA